MATRGRASAEFEGAADDVGATDGVNERNTGTLTLRERERERERVRERGRASGQKKV